MMRELFPQFDRTGDGGLDETEFEDYFRAMNDKGDDRGREGDGRGPD